MENNLKLIVSSADLSNKLAEIRNLAKNSIVNLIKSKGITKVDFMLDKEGRNYNDYNYDEDWVFDNRVWVDCYGKYSNEVGYISEVEIDANDNILLTAEGEDGTYTDDFVSQATGVYIDILGKLENILK